MIRVVLDTNVLLSALLFEAGVPNGIGHHQIHRFAGDGGQLLLQAEVSLHQCTWLDRQKLHQQIQIAATGIEVVAQSRSEQMHAQHLVPPAGLGDGVELGLGQGEAHRRQSDQLSIGCINGLEAAAAPLIKRNPPR